MHKANVKDRRTSGNALKNNKQTDSAQHRSFDDSKYKTNSLKDKPNKKEDSFLQKQTKNHKDWFFLGMLQTLKPRS